MTNLSPAAQAALDAYGDFEPANVDAMAAALRVIADHADRFHPLHGASEWGNGWGEGVHDTALGLRSIATELERFSD
jgi:hypothetical protein